MLDIMFLNLHIPFSTITRKLTRPLSTSKELLYISLSPSHIYIYIYIPHTFQNEDNTHNNWKSLREIIERDNKSGYKSFSKTNND